MADVSIRATLEGFEGLNAALKQVSTSLNDVKNSGQIGPEQVKNLDEFITGMKEGFAEAAKEAGYSQETIDKLLKSVKGGVQDTAQHVEFGSRMVQNAFIRLGREVMHGDVSRIPVTLFHIASHSRLLALAMNPVGAAIAAVAATVGVLTYGLITGSKEVLAINNALTTTGHFAGVTRGEINQLAESISRVGTLTVGTAKEIITQIVASGRYSAENIRLLTSLTENYAALTGESTDKTLPKLMKMFQDPAKASEELNKQYHYLSVEELERIRTLERTGQQQEAVTAAIRAFNGAVPEHVTQIGYAQIAWELLLKGLNRVKEGWKNLWVETPIEEQLRKGQREIEAAQRQGASKEYIKGLQDQQMVLMEQYAEQQRINKAKADAAEQNTKEHKAQELVLQTLQYQRKELQEKLTLAASIKDPIQRAQVELELNKKLEENARAQYATRKAMIDAVIAGEEKLFEIQTRGWTAAIESELKLGHLTQEEANRRKSILALELNYTKQMFTQEQLKNSTLSPDAEATLKYKLKQQYAEFQIIAQQMGQTEQKDRQVQLDREAETLYKQITEDLDRMTSVLNKQGEAQRSLNIAVKKQIEDEEFKATLIGKTSEQQALLTALRNLDLKYQAAGLALSGEMYEMDRTRLARAVQANADASKEVNQFWKTAAKDMQRAMSSFFFDIMQGNLTDLVGRFKQTVDRMIADALAAKAALALFGPDFTKSGSTAPVGGLIGQGLGWLGGMFGGEGTASMAAAAGNSGLIEGALLGPFAGGGSFTVGGSGGTDSKFVGFRATPGERVTVETPGQRGQRMTGDRVSVTNIFHVSGPVDRRSQAQIAAAAGEGVQRALARNT